jgi:hypothetical protein
LFESIDPAEKHFVILEVSIKSVETHLKVSISMMHVLQPILFFYSFKDFWVDVLQLVDISIEYDSESRP